MSNPFFIAQKGEIKNISLDTEVKKDQVFNEDDYNSNDGMVTRIWGPALWHSLHTMSFNYPVNPTIEQKKQYYTFFYSLRWTLPCRYCRENFVKNLEKLPLTKDVLKNRSSLSRWLYDLHNIVNEATGKPINLTYDEVRDRYEHFRSRCVTNKVINKEKEKGCTESLHGIKAKGQVHIVPYNEKIETKTNPENIIIDPRTKKTRN